jgi:hypothetical protein
VNLDRWQQAGACEGLHFDFEFHHVTCEKLNLNWSTGRSAEQWKHCRKIIAEVWKKKKP